MMKRLAAIRKRRRLSYRDIEKQTGIPAARMEELEKGAAGITVDELEKLLALYRVPIDRVMRFGRRRLLAVPAAMLAAAVLLAGAFFFLPEEWARPDSATAFPAGGTLAAAGAAGPEAANPLPERPADGSPEGGAPSGASAGPADLPGARPPAARRTGFPGDIRRPRGKPGSRPAMPMRTRLNRTPTAVSPSTAFPAPTRKRPKRWHSGFGATCPGTPNGCPKPKRRPAPPA